LDRYFKRRNKHGLRRVLRTLQDELLLLGLLSLLLIATEVGAALLPVGRSQEQAGHCPQSCLALALLDTVPLSGSGSRDCFLK
jgi:hypothetical protein